MRRLAIRPGAIGDFILSLPALECLAADDLEVWTASRNVPLVRFAHARSITSSGLDLLGIGEPPARLLEQLRGFDSIVSWYGANRPDFRDFVLQELRLPFTFFPALPSEGTGMHASDFYLQQVQTLVDCTSDGVPRIECCGPRDNYAVIHPFSGATRKNWPLPKFRALANKLQRLMPVHWCSSPEDPPLEGSVYLSDLYELACWLARARLYIGNDSGITHLAAAVGTPVLALFGPTDPEVWAPRGANVRVARWPA